MTGLQLRRGDREVALWIDGVEILRYVFDARGRQLESPRPYFHPLRTRAGHVVTVFRPHDHTWHKGLSYALPNVGADNFWGGVTYVRDRGYLQLPNNGAMRHTRLEAARISDAGVFELAHTLDWQREGGDLVATERRRLTVSPGAPGDDAWLLTLDSEVTNASGDTLVFGSPTTEGRDNAGYGGFFWRGPRSFTGGRILGPGGLEGEALRGARLDWAAFEGRHDEVDATSTVLMVDAAENPQHPPQWFARSEPFGCLGPAPYFSERVMLDEGGTMRNRYALVVADGASDTGRLTHLAERGTAALDAATLLATGIAR
ncbi:PmoA family protein [Micrococcales bacterium 31B]|nr:PmoA family protein [Micrococcales bacterium 31B]